MAGRQVAGAGVAEGAEGAKQEGGAAANNDSVRLAAQRQEARTARRVEIDVGVGAKHPKPPLKCCSGT